MSDLYLKQHQRLNLLTTRLTYKHEEFTKEDHLRHSNYATRLWSGAGIFFGSGLGLAV